MKKKLIGFLGIFAALAIPFMTMGNTLAVNAEETFDFNSTEVQNRCAELTDSDQISAIYTLDDYIDDVKNAEYEPGTDEEMMAHAELLDEVIPLEIFLNTGVYFFSGKEYAFYVKTFANTTSSTLIIDYDCVLDYNTNVVTMRIEMLQATYSVEEYEGGHRAVAYELSSAYYLQEPSFLGSIRNLHDINENDSDYRKQTDTGVVFEQLRLNYAGFYKYQTDFSSEFTEYILEYLFDEALDYFVDSLSYSDYISEGIDIFEGILAIHEMAQTKTQNVVKDNEENIIDEVTKANQVADPNRKYLTKLFSVKLDTDLCINDYMELKVVLSQENKPSLLDFGISFYITDGDGEKVFSTPLEIPFFKPIFENITTKNYTDSSHVYIFPQQKQVFYFDSKLQANYNLSTNVSNCYIKVYTGYDIATYTGSGLVSVNTDGTYSLEKDKLYYVEIANGNKTQIVRGGFSTAIVAPTLVAGSNTVNSNGLFILDSATLCYYDLIFANKTISIYDATTENCIASGSGSLTFKKSNAGILYVCVSASSGALSCTAYRQIEYRIPDENPQTLRASNGSLTNLPSPQKAGYNFVGWWLAEDYSGQSVTVAEVAALNQPDIILYAKWSDPNAYSITYVFPATTSDGYSVDEDLIGRTGLIDEYTVEDTVEFPTNISSVAYQLAGWYSDASFTNSVSGYPEGTTGNLTVYAKLNMRYYNVTFNENGGASCADNEVAYGTVITLPASERTGYIGSWDVWTNTDSYYPTSNFGNSYTVLEDVTFTAQWLRVYSINFQYVTFGTQTAQIYYGNYYFMYDYYVYGYGLDTSNLRASFPTETPYEPWFVFLGWYTDSNFTQRVTSIPSTAQGVQTLYAKWRYDLFSQSRTAVYTIDDDSDQFGQSYDRIYLGLSNTTLYNGLKQLGITGLTINFNLRLWEENDGYQNIYFYANSGADNLLYSITNLEYGSGSVKGSDEKGLFVRTITFDLEDLEGMDYLYIRYSANGSFSDTWKSDLMYVEVMFTAKEEDKDAASFTFKDEPDYGTVNEIR